MEASLDSKIFIVIIVICTVLLVVSFIKQKFDLIINFGIRIVAGFLAIYIINTLLQSFSIDLSVGINAINALTIGILGLPGFVLLYGLALYFFL